LSSIVARHLLTVFSTSAYSFLDICLQFFQHLLTIKKHYSNISKQSNINRLCFLYVLWDLWRVVFPELFKLIGVYVYILSILTIIIIIVCAHLRCRPVSLAFRYCPLIHYFYNSYRRNLLFLCVFRKTLFYVVTTTSQST